MDLFSFVIGFAVGVVVTLVVGVVLLVWYELSCGA